MLFRTALLALALTIPAMAEAADESSFAAGTRCATPASLARLGEPLRRVATRIADGSPLTIVAIGSSSTQGHGASKPENTYPARLEAHLHTLLPGLPITVINRGVGGEEARQMIDRFDVQVLPLHPDLVIWQVGSNSAMRGRSSDEIVPLIGEGIDRLHQANADVVLMNAQYAPAILARPRLLEYLMVMDDAIQAHRTGLLNRFDIMHRWFATGVFEAADVLTADGLHHNDQGYDCVARVLAEAIVDAASDALAHLDKDSSE
jgi:acyl-CoA thioesterase I